MDNTKLNHDSTAHEALLLRVVAMPSDTNPEGSIFGGWIMSQMDIAAGNLAHLRAKMRVVTAAVDSMSFIAPVHVGDVVSCYGNIIREGRTSIGIKIEVWVMRDRYGSEQEKVTEATFTFVAVDSKGHPSPLPPKLTRAN